MTMPFGKKTLICRTLSRPLTTINPGPPGPVGPVGPQILKVYPPRPFVKAPGEKNFHPGAVFFKPIHGIL
jgi:hypothetical protein